MFPHSYFSIIYFHGPYFPPVSATPPVAGVEVTGGGSYQPTGDPKYKKQWQEDEIILLMF